MNNKSNQIPAKKKEQNPVPFYLPVIAILALLLGMFYFLSKSGWFGIFTKKQTPTTPTPNLNQTKLPEEAYANWKVYEKGGESIKFAYPEMIKDCYTSITGSRLDLESRKADLTQVFCKTGSTYMQVVSEDSDQDLMEWWYSLYSENKNLYDKYGSSENVTFAGMDATQISFQKDGENENYNQTETLLHYVDRNYIVLFPHFLCPGNDCWEKAVEIQMSSAFEFTE